MSPIKALIIDDEELGRRIIREYLGSHPDILVLTECRDAREAREAIDMHDPDLLFLDIQLPEVNGFELLEMLVKIPYVVFSTAYDRYAVKAFEVNAVDYLLKPFDQERFDRAVERVKDRLRHPPEISRATRGIRDLLDHLRAEKPYLDKILVKKAGKYIILPVDHFIWIEATGDYVNIHAPGGSYLVLQSMAGLEARLDPNRFLRVHRSAIVHCEAVRDIVPWTNGRMKINLKNGEEVLTSRAGTKNVKRFLA